MRRKLCGLILVGVIGLILFSFADENDYFEPTVPTSTIIPTNQKVEGVDTPDTIGQPSADVILDEETEVFVLRKDLDGDSQKEEIYFFSYPYSESVVEGETLVVYVRGLWKETSFVRIGNRFIGALTHDLDKDGKAELFVKTMGGKLVYTYPFKFENQEIIRLAVFSEGKSFESFSTTSGLVAKDWDGDGKDEILVYYRFYPPEKRRMVSVYKFDGGKFVFLEEYEEETKDVFL